MWNHAIECPNCWFFVWIIEQSKLDSSRMLSMEHVKCFISTTTTIERVFELFQPSGGSNYISNDSAGCHHLWCSMCIFKVWTDIQKYPVNGIEIILSVQPLNTNNCDSDSINNNIETSLYIANGIIWCRILLCITFPKIVWTNKLSEQCHHDQSIFDCIRHLISN